jgi:Zn-dependent protease
MLSLLRLPIELLWIALYALRGLVDVLRARDRLRAETTVLIDVPREAVWRFIIANRVIFDGPPLIETTSEPVPDSDGLTVSRVLVNGQLYSQVAMRKLDSDEARGIILTRIIPHALSVPLEDARDMLAGQKIEATPQGTALTTFYELTARSFRDRIVYPNGLRRTAILIKQQCEKEAGRRSRLVTLANHGLVLSVAGLLSFWYLVGWELALLLSVVIMVHELGHAAAMRMVGIEVRGIYLIPFFGGAAVPKTAYRSEGQLGFVALMGPAMSLLPTFSLVTVFTVTGNDRFLQAATVFAAINLGNLMPLYPLDGGLILNSLLGSATRRFALLANWIGLLAGLGVAIYWHSLLIGIPFLLFVLQRYLAGARGLQLAPLSLAGAGALALASAFTFVAYLSVLDYTRAVPAAATWLTTPNGAALDGPRHHGAG